jgi:hypothetical protein
MTVIAPLPAFRSIQVVSVDGVPGSNGVVIPIDPVDEGKTFVLANGRLQNFSTTHSLAASVIFNGTSLRLIARDVTVDVTAYIIELN